MIRVFDHAPYVEVDGRVPSAVDLLPFAVRNDGHFTSLQVRGGAARGLALHLGRLVDQHRRLYDRALDPGRVRARMRSAAAAVPDGSMHVRVGPTDSVLVVMRPPSAPTAPIRLMTVPAERPVADVKHVGTFLQIDSARRAHNAGFDDALFVADDGAVLETTIANLAVARGRNLVWAAGAVLPGTSWALLDRALAPVGWTSRTEPMRVADLTTADVVVAANSGGIVAVTAVDDTALPLDDEVVRALRAAFEAIALEPI